MKCESCMTNKVLVHEMLPDNSLCEQCLADLFFSTSFEKIANIELKDD